MTDYYSHHSFSPLDINKASLLRRIKFRPTESFLTRALRPHPTKSHQQKFFDACRICTTRFCTAKLFRDAGTIGRQRQLRVTSHINTPCVSRLPDNLARRFPCLPTHTCRRFANWEIPPVMRGRNDITMVICLVTRVRVSQQHTTTVDGCMINYSPNGFLVMISSSRHFNLSCFDRLLAGVSSVFNGRNHEGCPNRLVLWLCALCVHFSEGRCRFANEKKHDYHVYNKLIPVDFSKGCSEKKRWKKGLCFFFAF